MWKGKERLVYKKEISFIWDKLTKKELGFYRLIRKEAL